MISHISSRTNQKVVEAAKLKNKKEIIARQEFLLEGIKSIEMALKANLVKEIFTIHELDNISEDIPQYIVNAPIISKLSSYISPEGVVAVVRTLPQTKPEKMHKVVYLDNIQDPGNIGTIIRTALAFNFDAIVVSEDSVSIYNPKVVAASKGAMFLIPIITGELKEFKGSHKIIISTLQDDSIELSKLEKPTDFVLVLGNEAHGVRQETLALSDINVKIQINNIDSLNVAIAGAILMHHLQ